MDYCSPVWSPHHVTEIQRLESVQRMFTKYLHGFHGLSYAERLKKLGLCTLELRRLLADLTLCFKMLYRFTIVSDLNLFFTHEANNRTRGHSMRLKASKPRLDTKRYCFAYRTAKVWNGLKSDTVCAPNVTAFRCLLLKENLSLHLSTNYDYL